MNTNFHDLEKVVREGDHLMIDAIETRRPIIHSIAGGYVVGGCFGSTFREAVVFWLSEIAKDLMTESDLDC